MGKYSAMVVVFEAIDNGSLKPSDKREVKSCLVSADSELTCGEIKEFCDYASEALDYATDCPETFLAVLAYLGKLAATAKQRDAS